jgi:hypothetical protein
LRRRFVTILAALAGLAGFLVCEAPSFAATKVRSTTAATTTAPASGTPTLGSYRLVSYTPTTSQSGTTGLAKDLWGSYDPTQVRSDLSLLRGMGADAVRVFVSTGDTGASYPAVSRTFRANLADFVGAASGDGLKVVLSIFNQYPYIPAVTGGWSDTASAATWMAAVVGPYRSDPEIAYIEMRNEIPAPGYDSPNPLGSGLLAASWLNTLMPQLRADAGIDPVVLSQNHGVAGYEALDGALSSAAKPDAYAYHFYDVPGLLYGQLTTLQQSLSRPVFVGEAGYSVALTNPTGGGARLAQDSTVRDAYQGWYLQAVSAVTSAMGLGTPGVWQLWDTPNASSAYEADFGLYSGTSGSPVAKPAVGVLSGVFARAAAGLPIPPPSINGAFDEAGTAAGTEVPSPWNSYYIAGQTSSTPLGGRSLCITGAGTDSYFFEYLPLAGASGTHTLSAWTSGGNGYTSIAIRWLNSTGTPLGLDARSFQPGTVPGWLQLATTGVAPPGASTAEVILQGDTAGCFANVSFS